MACKIQNNCLSRNSSDLVTNNSRSHSLQKAGVVNCSFGKRELQAVNNLVMKTSSNDESLLSPMVNNDTTSSNDESLLSPMVNNDTQQTTTFDEHNGKFGIFGGKFVPETLIACLGELESAFNSTLMDFEFQMELMMALRDYVGRETPLYFAKRLTDYYKSTKGTGPDIYLKREDLNHGGSHKMNNVIGQAMLAKRLGRNTIVAATGAGQHGVATAAACAKLDLKCIVFMGSKDIERHHSNVMLMEHLGAEVKCVNGGFKDASSEAFRFWVSNLETSYLLSGIAVGPHPCPKMVCEFQSIIGKEIRTQAMEKWGGNPDVLVACVGSGSNALGLFHEFLGDDDVRLIGVEAKHSATLERGEVGVYHGAMSYLLQDEEGQIIEPYSIGLGMEYPAVSPQLSYLKDMGRAEFHSVTDEEALQAYERLCKLEGIFPALEASHALAFLEKLCPTLADGTKVVVNLSGSGDKDAIIVATHMQQNRTNS